MTLIEELVARLGLEVDAPSFAAGEKVIAAIRGGMIAVVAAGAAVGAAVVGAAAKTAAYADQVEKAAQRTGIATDALQALQYAAERADVGVGELQAALNFMAKRGVKDFEGELRRAADEFQRMPDGATKAARAMQLFGKNGAQLIPMLNGGAAGLDEMTEKARAMGLILSDDALAAGADLKDALEDVQGYIRGLAYTIGGPFMKALREALERFTKWIRENRPVIQKWAEAVGRFVGGALRTVLQLLEPVVDLLMRFQTWVLSSVPGMITAFTALGFAIGWPWALAVAGIAAFLMAIEELWGWMTGKRKHTLLGEWLGSFEDFKKGFEGNPIVKFLTAIAEAAERAVDGLSKIGRLMLLLKTGTTPETQDHQDYAANLSEAYRRTGLAEVPGSEFAIASDPRFNDLVRSGDFDALEREYGRRSVFRKQQESQAAGFVPAIPLPSVPTPFLQGGNMNLTLNVNAPAGVDTRTWASQLADDLSPHLERFWDAQMSHTRPAVAGRP